jgi:acetylornithine deacetylase/succinyl-diaminopimelate desuccinylase-like protein
MERLFRYIEANKGIFLNELKEFLSIPSISAQSDHNADTRLCAKWVADQMHSIGMQDVQIFETPGHPIVYCEWMGAPDSPAILFYGHYDVQPVDPLNLWTSPPFEATLRGKNLYARGSVDDKGQVFIQLKSIEAYMKNFGTLPLNIKMLIEGEEEIGSVNLKEFLKEHKDLLKADSALVSDTSMFKEGIPSVCYGLRGLTFMEMEVTGPDRDLHSGAFGGSIHNPIQALCEMIAVLHDENGKVTIPGFYEDILPLTDSERGALKELPHNDEIFAKELGIKMLYGEKGFGTLERLWARPTLECNGIWGGYTGEGAKTVLPSKAYAKISMRLVPNQEPEKMATLFLEYIRQIAPGTINVKVHSIAGSEPVITPVDSPWIKAVVSALEKGFGTKPVYQREGGSIPIVAQLKKILNLDPVLVGFGLPDANAHAPDEHLNLDNFFGGIRTLVYFFNEFQS